MENTEFSFSTELTSRGTRRFKENKNFTPFFIRETLNRGKRDWQTQPSHRAALTKAGRRNGKQKKVVKLLIDREIVLKKGDSSQDAKTTRDVWIRNTEEYEVEGHVISPTKRNTERNDFFSKHLWKAFQITDETIFLEGGKRKGT